MKINIILNNIYHIEFKKRVSLCSSFLRMQEYFESPHFRNKIFSLKEFKNWYIKNSPRGIKTGKFTYYSDWSGFNLPSYIFKPFFENRFNPLTKNEKILLDEIKKIKSPSFYIIGTFGEDDITTYIHEIAHGLFYTESDYKNKIVNILNSIPEDLRKQMNNYLQDSGGYHSAVFEDETHAYLTGSMKSFKKYGIDTDKLVPYSEDIKHILNQYLKPLNIKA